MTISINNSILAIRVNKRINFYCLIIISIAHLDSKTPACITFYFCQLVNLTCHCISDNLLSSSIRPFDACIRTTNNNITCAVAFGHRSLRSSQNHRAFSNQRLLTSLVNIASQSRNQQGSQDSQNDQNNDQFDEGEALFVLQFLNILFSSKNFL